jgi:KUP system potassium uptake protein
VPMSLLHNLKHNQVLHQKVVLMTIHTRDIPSVPEEQRLEVEKLGKGFHRVTVSYGFMESPNVPRALDLCRAHALAIDPTLTTFFLTRETLIGGFRSEAQRVKRSGSGRPCQARPAAPGAG